ncbi:DNA cytosine methyltransferase [Streptomyces ipomoeae]|uniref:Cytosine-specific methyltransferase n=1 Tax=Streptomyces ipomoeae 91-03 TaxID=698759 RepID=L1L016_9ACTN|nr:DNA cytosine methyltransferase [Streptomyces ipomoeae]EKX65943.1 DNA (cytosine-5-)-methyltransferase [Streptomyces ipomoeae 91-03]MDX2697562.1 DNA cytosine methyltransferase [Streptomyces ipomoeae]MDX2824357.1 DNA cytosine methyltransferase [Streptomyces ipomoeae]MDX2843327.1 DNA cytosine methyltransferase [Streptomyces ipomoeae]MDX2877021.1 DNA cytosine methyltransferase [Streptomyces ipomoeae]
MTTTSTDPATGAAPDDSSIKVVDLFSGAGGFSAGFRAYEPAGPGSSPFESVAAVEYDEAAAATYAVNFGASHVANVDIATWDPEPYRDKVDVIMGGPPCQGFSALHRNNPEKPKVDDPRNRLWVEYVRVVRAINPKIFVLENVDRFLKSQEFESLQAATSDGGPLANYTLRWKILNAADYGVPQARRRAIVIATRNDLGEPMEHPRPTHARDAGPQQPSLNGLDGPEQQLLPWVPVWQEVFSRTPEAAPELNLPERTDKPLGVTLPGPYKTTELHIGRNPTPLSRARYRAIPPGGNRHDLRDRWAEIEGVNTYLSTKSWDSHNSGSGDVMGRMHANRPSVTIRTEFYKPEKGRYLHPKEDRPITHYEAALIQGFPLDFKWFGTKVEIARQIGNAVPIGLGRALAQAIHERLEG